MCEGWLAVSILTYDDGFNGRLTFTGMLLRVTSSHSARQQRGAEVVECTASRIDWIREDQR